MGTDAKDTGNRRGECVEVGDLLQGSSTGSSTLWLLNLGADPPHGQESGRVI